MAKMVLTVNGLRRKVDADGEMPRLWLLRDHLGRLPVRHHDLRPGAAEAKV